MTTGRIDRQAMENELEYHAEAGPKMPKTIRPCGVCKDSWEDDELYLCEGGCMECCLECVVFDEEGCALCPSCAAESIS